MAGASQACRTASVTTGNRVNRKDDPDFRDAVAVCLTWLALVVMGRMVPGQLGESGAW